MAAAAGPMAWAQSPKNIVIASANGPQPCKKAMEMLKSGTDTLDAVIAGVNIIELDPSVASPAVRHRRKSRSS